MAPPCIIGAMRLPILSLPLLLLLPRAARPDAALFTNPAPIKVTAPRAAPAADAAGWYGTTTAWREDFTANWNSTGPKRAVKRQLNRDKEAEEMAKAKIKIKVSDSGIVTLAASGDGYATLNALVEVLAATICEASPNWDFAEIMTDAAVNRLYDLVDDGTRKKVIRRGE